MADKEKTDIDILKEIMFESFPKFKNFVEALEALAKDCDPVKPEPKASESELIVQFRSKCKVCGNTLHFLRDDEWICGECDANKKPASSSEFDEAARIECNAWADKYFPMTFSRNERNLAWGIGMQMAQWARARDAEEIARLRACKFPSSEAVDSDTMITRLQHKERELTEENQRLTLENKKLDAACKVWEEYEEKFQEHLGARDKRIGNLTAALKLGRNSLQEMIINFNGPVQWKVCNQVFSDAVIARDKMTEALAADGGSDDK